MIDTFLSIVGSLALLALAVWSLEKVWFTREDDDDDWR